MPVAQHAIVTFTSDSLKYRDRFSELIWTHLRPLVIEKARSDGRTEINEEDMKACMEIAVAEALKTLSDQDVN